jgi:hypothetical protein
MRDEILRTPQWDRIYAGCSIGLIFVFLIRSFWIRKGRAELKDFGYGLVKPIKDHRPLRSRCWGR